MHNTNSISASKALEWLIEGNNDYLNAKNNHSGDISQEKRMHTHKHGQSPFAVIITCSDSRVIPENIFMKGIGDSVDGIRYAFMDVKSNFEILYL